MCERDGGGGPQGELVRVGQIGRCKRWNDDRVGCMQQLVQPWCCCHALIADAILNQLSPCVPSLRAASFLLFSPSRLLLLLFCSFFIYFLFLSDLFLTAISLLWQLYSTSPISFLCPRLWHLYPLFLDRPCYPSWSSGYYYSLFQTQSRK